MPLSPRRPTWGLRLRPILMTTMTTALGLLPLALGLGAGANLQAALARVVIGGLLASSLITLVLIPTLYLGAHEGLEQVRELAGRRPGRRGSATEPTTAG